MDVCLNSTQDSSEHKTFFSDPMKSSRQKSNRTIKGLPSGLRDSKIESLASKIVDLGIDSGTRGNRKFSTFLGSFVSDLSLPCSLYVLICHLFQSGQFLI